MLSKLSLKGGKKLLEIWKFFSRKQLSHCGCRRPEKASTAIFKSKKIELLPVISLKITRLKSKAGPTLKRPSESGFKKPHEERQAWAHGLRGEGEQSADWRAVDWDVCTVCIYTHESEESVACGFLHCPITRTIILLH